MSPFGSPINPRSPSAAFVTTDSIWWMLLSANVFAHSIQIGTPDPRHGIRRRIMIQLSVTHGLLSHGTSNSHPLWSLSLSFVLHVTKWQDKLKSKISSVRKILKVTLGVTVKDSSHSK